MRFQELMPDPLLWLGIGRIDRLVSMSNLKFDALTRQGIEIVERVALPDDLIPEDARVEMEAKKAAGYYAGEVGAGEIGRLPDDLSAVKGRGLVDYCSCLLRPTTGVRHELYRL